MNRLALPSIEPCDPAWMRSHALLPALALLLSATAQGAPPSSRGPKAAMPAMPAMTEFDTPAAALSSLLAEEPSVVAFGEYHEIVGAVPKGVKIPSSLAHFADELLPTIAPSASDLILETWVAEGNCGKEEKAVVAQVEETTKRPETTETELVKLIKKAKAAGVQPHILTVSCKDYQALLDDKGEVDYVKLLAAITRMLERKIDERLAARSRTTVAANPAAATRRTVMVYGGALHNDLRPRRELRAYSFGAAVQKTTHGHYLEVDLYVPEFIEKDKDIVAERWYRLLERREVTKTALVHRSPGSWALVFPRTPPVAPEPAPRANAVPEYHPAP